MKTGRLLFFTFLELLIAVMCLWGCINSNNGTSSLEDPVAQEVDFKASYVRTAPPSDECEFPITVAIHSFEELEKYCNNKTNTHITDATMIEYCKRYDSDFFKTNALVFVVLEETSGSITHEVQYVTRLDNGVLSVAINAIIPGTTTDDMAYWHIIIETKKENVPSDSDKIVVLHMTKNQLENTEKSSTENTNFSFSLTWGVYGISSYDSKTGRLIKTKHATNPNDYVTRYCLTEEQNRQVYLLLKELDIESYPNEYNPHGEGESTPYMTLSLSFKDGSTDKTVTVPRTVLSYDTKDEKGMKFLNTVDTIISILTETEEWKSLPEYEFYYD